MSTGFNFAHLSLQVEFTCHFDAVLLQKNVHHQWTDLAVSVSFLFYLFFLLLWFWKHSPESLSVVLCSGWSSNPGGDLRSFNVGLLVNVWLYNNPCFSMLKPTNLFGRSWRQCWSWSCCAFISLKHVYTVWNRKSINILNIMNVEWKDDKVIKIPHHHCFICSKRYQKHWYLFTKISMLLIFLWKLGNFDLIIV